MASCAATAPRVAAGRCSGSVSSAFCDVTCLTDGDCAFLGDMRRCEEGYCRTGSSGFTDGGADRAPDSAACTPPDITPDQLLVLGDSLIELTSFTSHLEQRAIEEGAIVQGEKFRQQASAMMSLLADGAFSIGAQYSLAREAGVPRVVVMDGGETDLFQGVCDAEPVSSCPNIEAAVSGAQALLKRMADDGVEHVVYFFYPDPIGNAVLENGLNVLRPLVQNACGHASLACHWVDLRPEFAGHPEYFAADGVLISDEGARVTANAVWDRMRQRCIAQ